jgi:hypothetical protein
LDLTHGAEGVEHQVQHHLLELNVVGLDQQDAGPQVEFDGDLVGDSVAVGDAIDVADELIEIEAGEARRVALGRATSRRRSAGNDAARKTWYRQ